MDVLGWNVVLKLDWWLNLWRLFKNLLNLGTFLNNWLLIIIIIIEVRINSLLQIPTILLQDLVHLVKVLTLRNIHELENCRTPSLIFFTFKISIDFFLIFLYNSLIVLHNHSLWLICILRFVLWNHSSNLLFKGLTRIFRILGPHYV